MVIDGLWMQQEIDQCDGCDRAEIRVQFRHVPGNLYKRNFGTDLDLATNELVIRVQPDEAIYLKINNKVPGLGMRLDRSNLNLHYADRYAVIPSFNPLLSPFFLEISVEHTNQLLDKMFASFILSDTIGRSQTHMSDSYWMPLRVNAACSYVVMNWMLHGRCLLLYCKSWKSERLVQSFTLMAAAVQ